MPDIAWRLAQGYEQIIAALHDRDDLPPNAEVYFNLGRTGALDYYLIDHAKRQPYWIFDTNTDELAMAPYESEGFLSTSAASGVGYERLTTSTFRIGVGGGILDPR